MPAYNTAYPPPFLAYEFPLNTYLVFSKEAIVAGEFSQQVSIPLGLVAGQKGIRVELDFNQNPGAYEIDVMESDNDLLGGSQYQQVPTGGALTTVTTGANGPNTHQSTDLIPVAGQFVLLYVKTAPANGGTTVTARITRAA
ncbi:MAG: hypothetical protein WBQ94_14240 [Terracidiphilus sp.]